MTTAPPYDSHDYRTPLSMTTAPAYVTPSMTTAPPYDSPVTIHGYRTPL